MTASTTAFKPGDVIRLYWGVEPESFYRLYRVRGVSADGRYLYCAGMMGGAYRVDTTAQDARIEKERDT